MHAAEFAWYAGPELKQVFCRYGLSTHHKSEVQLNFHTADDDSRNAVSNTQASPVELRLQHKRAQQQQQVGSNKQALDMPFTNPACSALLSPHPLHCCSCFSSTSTARHCKQQHCAQRSYNPTSNSHNQTTHISYSRMCMLLLAHSKPCTLATWLPCKLHGQPWLTANTANHKLTSHAAHY